LLGLWTPSGIRFSWDVYPGALCYSIYKAVDALDPYGDYTIVAECVPDNDVILPVVDPSLDCGWFVITSLTPEGETEISDPIYIDCTGAPVCAPSSVSITSDSNFNPIVEGAAIVFTAHVTGNPPGAVTGTVTFYDGVTILGLVPLTVPGAELWEKSCSLSVNWLTNGNHTIKAIYNGDADNCLSTSSTHGQVVFLGGGGCVDCDPSDASIDMSGTLWGVQADDGVARWLAGYLGSVGIMADAGYGWPDGTTQAWVWLEGTVEYYVEYSFMSDPIDQSVWLWLWLGSRCIDADPNGNYTRIDLDLDGSSQFIDFLINTNPYEYYIDNHAWSQLATPLCAEVKNFSGFLFGLPGTDNIPF
jgi:hypothetical protein